MAISDLLMGVYLIIIAGKDMNYGQSYEMLSRIWQSSSTCRAAGTLAFLSSQASLMFLLILSAYHFIAVLRPVELPFFGGKFTAICSSVTWIFTGVLGTIFAVLVGPADNGEFGLSDVCISLPYFIKPDSYTIEVGGERPTQNKIILPTTTPETSAWYFLATIFLGWDLVCVLSITALLSRIFIFRARHRNNTNQTKEYFKNCVKLAPVFILKIVCWLIIISTGFWSLVVGNTVQQNVYSWLILFVFTLGSCLGPTLYLVMILVYFIVHRTLVTYEPIDDQCTTNEQALVPESHRQDNDDRTIELKTQEEDAGSVSVRDPADSNASHHSAGTHLLDSHHHKEQTGDGLCEDTGDTELEDGLEDLFDEEGFENARLQLFPTNFNESLA